MRCTWKKRAKPGADRYTDAFPGAGALLRSILADVSRWKSRESRRGAWVAVCSVTFASFSAAHVTGCLTDHDALAKRPSGAGGAAGSAAADAGGPFGGTSSSGGTPSSLFPPDGEDELVLMHGAADAEEILICFRRVEGSDVSAPAGEPAPGGGLSYGSALRPDLGDFNLDEDDVQPLVFAGELERLNGLDCEEALELAERLDPPFMPAEGTGGSSGEAGGASGAAGESAAGGAGGQSGGTATGGEGGGPATALQRSAGPRPLRLRALPAFPKGSLTRGRNVLAVVTGCLGGPGYAADREQEICGASYSPSRPTVSLAVVSPWRSSRFDYVGLMVFNASRAAGAVRFESAPPPEIANPPRQIAGGVAYGALVPRTITFDYSAADLGFSAGTYSVRVVAGSGSALELRWSAIQAKSKLDAVRDGNSYVAVLLGPHPDLSADAWWNAPAVRLVKVAGDAD